MKKSNEVASGRLPWRGLFYVIGACAILLAAIYWMSSRPTLDEQASSILTALVDDDPDIAYSYTHEFQRESVGLTKEKYRILWQSLIRPRFQDVKQVKPPESYVQPGEHQGVASMLMRTGGGVEFEISTAAWATDSGGRIGLFNLLIEAWNVEYVHNKGQPLTTRSALEARLRGIQADRERLEQLGITGWPPAMPGQSITPWTEMIATWSARLQGLEKEEKQ